MKAEKSDPNRFGIYHDTYRPRDTKKKTQCYYLCDPGNECVNCPSVGKWYDTVPKTFDEEIQALERASRNKEQRALPADTIDLVSKAKSLLQERTKLDNEERETKRRCLVARNEESSNFTENSNSSATNATDPTSVPTPPTPPTPCDGSSCFP